MKAFGESMQPLFDLYLLLNDTTYAVARIWSSFCLPFDCAQDKRQHGTFHRLCAVFRAERGKPHTNKNQVPLCRRQKTPSA